MADILKRFRVGQRVRMTPDAFAYGLAIRRHGRTISTGRVTAIRWPLSLTVQRDGLKHPTQYHCAFWEPIPKGRRLSGRGSAELRRQHPSARGSAVRSGQQQHSTEDSNG